jgi:hypothetical protein
MRGLLGSLVSVAILAQPACGLFSRSTLPTALGDAEFWALTTQLSEPPGSFTHSETLVSNEARFVDLVRVLQPAGGVYIGVGPEQNFSYIAAAQPELAFIVDIRRENLNLHLLYKALFELSGDRRDFVARLFSREPPPGVDVDAPVADLFAALEQARPSPHAFESTKRAVRERLLGTRRFPLTPADLEWIDHAFGAFYADGPQIHYARDSPNDPKGPSYQTLMTAADFVGQARSYLASEQRFAYVRSMQASNRIVPVVGDFGGADALGRIATYIRQHGGHVRSFYASNVEVYLNREKKAAYCRNLAQLPMASTSWYITGNRVQPASSKLKACGFAGIEN